MTPMHHSPEAWDRDHPEGVTAYFAAPPPMTGPPGFIPVLPPAPRSTTQRQALRSLIRLADETAALPGDRLPVRRRNELREAAARARMAFGIEGPGE